MTTPTPLTTEQIDARLQLFDYTKATPDALSTQIKADIAAVDAFLNNLDSRPTPSDADSALAVIHHFDALSARLYRDFNVLSHLNNVMSSEAVRDTYNALLPDISALGVRAGQSMPLYQHYQHVSEHFDSLSDAHKSPVQKRAIALGCQSFELSGVALAADDKHRLADIQSRLSSLSAQFSDHVLDATHAYAYPLDAQQLSGITQTGRALLNAAAKARPELNCDHAATLDVPAYLAVMQYADDRALREHLYHAYQTRASDQSEHTQFDNAAIITEILNLRQEKAALLGFLDYSALSLAKKMADSSSQVEDFLYELANHAKPFAKQDLDELKALGATLGIDEAQPWDVPYLSEKIRQEKYAINSDEMRPYFPLPKVLDGLFDICQTLFGIDIRAHDSVSVWHDDARFFSLHNQSDGALLGGFYLDLFTRAGKRGGAWLSGYQSRHHDADTTLLPVGYIVCNFAPATADTPACLSFDEVTTLFHEFGHALHHLLSDISVSAVAGIDSVEWDAVELPSQFMENFILTDTGIEKISGHVKTGAPLPQDKLNAILRAKNFQSGLQTLRQLEFALFDLYIHSKLKDTNFAQVLAAADKVRQDVAVLTTPTNNRFMNSFSHIFAGGYASGYYSYKWAERLSADAFARFEEEGIFNANTGRAFRKEILAQAGARDAKHNFRAFRGRDATSDALLRHSGFVKAA